MEAPTFAPTSLASIVKEVEIVNEMEFSGNLTEPPTVAAHVERGESLASGFAGGGGLGPIAGVGVACLLLGVGVGVSVSKRRSKKEGSMKGIFPTPVLSDGV